MFGKLINNKTAMKDVIATKSGVGATARAAGI